MERPLLRLAALIAGSAIYGFALGSAHSWLYATRNLAKFPLLITGTALLCALAYHVTARSLGVALPIARVQRLALGLFADASLLLASLAPATFFVGRILAHTDDKALGEYGMFLGWNVLLIALCGALALVHQARALLLEAGIGRRRAVLVVLCWLGLSLGVGGQGAFWLRPFFGLPASRGGNPPFALGATPDVRGATNFYEAVWQIIESPPLPESWR